MEPWQEEQLYQMALELRRQRRPWCVCCDEPIGTASYLDLTAFGLAGVACENCVDQNLGCTEDLDG